MHPYYLYYQTPQQSSPWYNPSYIPQAYTSFESFANPQKLLPSTQLTNPYHFVSNQNPETNSNSNLIKLLDDRTKELKRLHDQDQQEQFPILIDLIVRLRRVPKSELVSAAQNDFFSMLQTPFIDILQQWHRVSFLTDNESFMFRSTTKLIYKLIKAVDDIKLIPLWLSDSMLLRTIAQCLTDLATSGKFLDSQNKYSFKYFTLLIDAYILYQQHLNQQNYPNKDIFVRLLDPMLQCLTSNHFITAFTDLQIDSKSMTTIQKFFLLKSSAFITSYNGSHLEQTIDTLLTTMLPHYLKILDQFVPLAHKWNRSVIRSIQHLLETINHGANQFSINAKLISNHLSLIDHVLTIVNEPMIYNNLHETLSNLQTNLMNTAINFLLNMINEPIILAHIKQSRVASIFVRLTSCKYEALVLNVYNILAYTTHEDDIKTMHNVGRLLLTIIQRLKTTINGKFDKQIQIEQSLETLKGLVQHDQIKDEIIKQNVLPFLLDCTYKLTGRAHALIFEILWSLTFHDEGALALRSNENFLKTLQAISKDSNDEPLKKAADGLVWKLVREPAFLEKVAKQAAEEKNSATEGIQTTTEGVINDDNQQGDTTTIKLAINATGERVFQYDIMISYCHADKELSYKIHKFLLKQGFKIWIDLDNMYGPAMTAMADAVENSEFVIMCMSDSYKQSTYCQAEAEYAFNCKRRLIPLIMRPKYRPDGWLGFMIGSRIYVDFGRYDFDIACEKLMTEISLQSKRPLPSKIDSIGQHDIPEKTVSKKKQSSTSADEKSLVNVNNNIFSEYRKRNAMSFFNRKSVDQWTQSDVLDFLSSERLIEMMALCETMNGRTLIQLHRMCMSRGSRMYGILNLELKSTYKTKLPIGVFTRFLSTMEERLMKQPIIRSQTTFSYPKTITTDNPNEYISHTSRIPVIDFDPSQYHLSADNAYDLVITSDAPTIQILKTVQRYGVGFAKQAFEKTWNSVQH